MTDTTTDTTTSTLGRVQVAAALQVTPRTLRRLVLLGAIPAPIRVGQRRVCWRAADIAAFLSCGGTPGFKKVRRGRPRKQGGVK